MDIRVVRGAPTEEELAALVAVLATRATAVPQPPPAVPSHWRDHAARLGVRRPGRRAWWASGLPG